MRACGSRAQVQYGRFLTAEKMGHCSVNIIYFQYSIAPGSGQQTILSLVLKILFIDFGIV